MNEEEFIETVHREASLESKDTAQDVTTATMETLCERITDGEASDIAQHLPDEVAVAILDAPGEAEPFSLDEFTTRVSERSGVDESNATEYSRAVATALSMAAADELEIAREQLPSEFDFIFEPGGPITVEEFLKTVRERAGIDSNDAANDAILATLRALGERLSEGEAADLGLYLPKTFAEELVDAGDGSAMDYSLDEFVRRVSKLEGVETADAKIHAQAVGSALAETASGREIDAAKKQLPDPFGVIFEPPYVPSDEP